MKTRLNYIILFLTFSIMLWGQIPYAFRYQASVRDVKNRPINEEVVFDIRLFTDNLATNEVYREIHIIQPDTNGIVTFSIGEGASNDDFSSIQWAQSAHYIQILLNDEELSFSQLASVPYAMHAATASAIYNLEDPILDNDPSTKRYVDSTYHLLIDSIALLNNLLNQKIESSKAYADSLSLAPKDLEITSSGDTLQIGNKKVVITGMSSKNLEKYPSQRCLGGSYNENVIKSLKCKDGNMIILGASNSGNGDVPDYKGNTDIWVTKVDIDLNILWSKTLGGSLYDNGVFILEEEDGYLIAGTSESNDFDMSKNHGEFDLFLSKLDLNGNTLWQENYGGSSTEFLNSIAKLDNGNYLIGATTFSNDEDVYWSYGNGDMWVFQIDNERSIVKEKIIGGSKYDALQSIVVNDDKSLTVWGTSASNDGSINTNNGNLDIAATELNAAFEIQSHTCYGSMDNEQLTNVIRFGNNTLIYGESYAANRSIDNTISLNNIRLQCIGEHNWTKSLGGSLKDHIISVQVNKDTLTVLSQTNSSDGDISELKGAQDIWIVQLNVKGEIIRERCFGGTYDETAQILLPHNDGWLIGGTTESNDQDVSTNTGQKDIWIVMLNKDLELNWQKSYGGSYKEIIENIIPHTHSEITIIGTTSSNDYKISGLHDKAGTSSDIWILNTTIE